MALFIGCQNQTNRPPERVSKDGFSRMRSTTQNLTEWVWVNCANDCPE